MGERKRREKVAEPINLPISEGGPEITATDIFPTIDAMWLDFAKHPALQDVSRARREMTKFAFYTAIAETLRTVAYRINVDQDTRVFDDFDKELKAYDRELQRVAEGYVASFN
jgi:hypothetical protein